MAWASSARRNQAMKEDRRDRFLKWAVGKMMSLAEAGEAKQLERIRSWGQGKLGRSRKHLSRLLEGWQEANHLIEVGQT